MIVIASIFVGTVFVLGIIMFISPKFRGKMMSRQIKAQRYMVEESKDDLKSISNDMADVTKEGLKTASRAIREGFKENNIVCKHCGYEIDDDSRFCKKCGKEQ